MVERDRETEGIQHVGELDLETKVEDEVQDEKAEQEETGDELSVLRRELEEARASAAEYLDGWQRARAELANARKRFQREQEQSYINARADVLAKLLPIADDFERAFETLPDNLSGLTWIEGIELVQRKLQSLVEQAGVVPVEAAGQEFDPHLHEAATHEPSATVPAGHVIAELQKGYRLGDRILRPSMVRVSAGPLPEPAVPGSDKDGEAEADATADDE